MKYRVAIYDLEYQIEAKSTEGAIRAAIALYAKTETAQTSRHCSPDRLTRGPTIAEGRKWEAVFEKTGSKSARHMGRWVPCKYIQGAASIQVCRTRRGHCRTSVSQEVSNTGRAREPTVRLAPQPRLPQPGVQPDSRASPARMWV